MLELKLWRRWTLHLFTKINWCRLGKERRQRIVSTKELACAKALWRGGRMVSVRGWNKIHLEGEFRRGWRYRRRKQTLPSQVAMVWFSLSKRKGKCWSWLLSPACSVLSRIWVKVTSFHSPALAFTKTYILNTCHSFNQRFPNSELPMCLAPC